MKNLFFVVAVLIVGITTACNNTTPTPKPAMLPPQPPQPVVAATEQIKSLQSPVAADAPVITYNEIKEGVIDEPSAVDEWVFEGKAGERVNVVLNGNFDSYLELFNPDGELIAGSDDSANTLNAALFDTLLTKSGMYAIKIRGYGGQMGNYALALTGGHPTIGGGMLTDGENRNAVLSEEGFKWRYQGQKGAYLSVGVQGEQGIDPFLSLYGPDGALLTQDDDSGGNLNPEIIDFELPADGVYTIRAHTIASTGLVTLTLNSSQQSSGGGPLAVGKTQSGLLKPGRSHRWNFAGEAGQIINVSMVSPEFDTFLELRDANDTIIAENDDGPDGTNAMIDAFVLPANDTYTVVARALSADEGGQYEITLKPVKIKAGGGPLPVGESVQASLRPGQIDTWSFEAEADSYISIKIQSNQLDTYLELFDPDGQLITADDDSGGELNAALLDFPVATAGEYQVVVKSAQPDGNQAGVYEILLSVADSLESSGTLESGQVVTRTLKAGEQHTWTFEAEEDTFITVRMDSDTLDTYLSLYDSSGELLYVNDDFFAKQAAIANYVAPKSDTYRLVARAYSPEEEGQYTISLDLTDTELPINLPAGKEPGQQNNN